MKKFKNLIFYISTIGFFSFAIYWIIIFGSKLELGKKIKQYDMNNNLLNEYISISDASRKTSIPKSTISLHLKDNTKTNGREFIWK